MRLALLLLAVATALLLVGCGGETAAPLPDTVEGTVPTETTAPGDGDDADEGDAAAGKGVYASAGCGSCHVLADAGSTGAVGPNLDESMPDFDLVVERVTNGKGAMPPFAGQLTDDQIANVAAYVVQASSGG